LSTRFFSSRLFTSARYISPRDGYNHLSGQCCVTAQRVPKFRRLLHADEAIS
jgi:hypothetical protein